MYPGKANLTSRNTYPARRPALSRLEIAVILGVIATLLLLCLPDQSTRIRWKIERRARQWTATAADRVSPHECIIAPAANITGKWSTDRHLNFTEMSISHIGPEYKILFSTGGCLGNCDFERTGEFHKGILTLDSPVAEYFPSVAYDRLFAVCVGEEEMLLPQAYVREFQAGLSEDHGAFTNEHVPRLYALRRAEKEHDQENQK